MTAQIGEIVKYKRKKFELSGLTDPIPFNPLQFGLRPYMTHTANYDGFIRTFKISNSGLFLEKLEVNDERYATPELLPVINGSKPAVDVKVEQKKVYHKNGGFPPGTS